MRLYYLSPKGGKPYRIGMNAAKRIARSADKRDQLAVLRELGPGLPRQHSHHQEIVQMRRDYERSAYEEAVNEREKQAERLRQAASQSGDPSPSDPASDGSGGAVSDAADRADSGERPAG